MGSTTRLRFTDLVVMICATLLFAVVVLPAVFCSAGHSREAVCRNNLKFIGAGIEMWNQHAGCYPLWDCPGLDGNPRNLCTWLDLLAMQNAYTSENIEAQKDKFVKYRLAPDDFIKTIDDDKVFMCPADRPHPHRINRQRSDAWNFNAFDYSYSLNAHLSVQYMAEEFDQYPNKQILSADGLWDWSVDLRGEWVTNPNADFNDWSWWSNTVGYWHKRNSANFILRDLHVENHKYPPDTNKIYFYFREWGPY